MHAYVRTYVRKYVPTYLPICYIHTYRHTYRLTHIHTYVRTYVHTYIYTYIHTYILTYLHTCILPYIHTHIHTYTHTYLHTYILTYLHTYLHTYTHTHIHTYTHTHTYIHTYVHAYIHPCMHAYIQTYRQTHTHTLAQNSHCEFWCGMRLTCKKTLQLYKPDRNWLMTRGEKIRNGSLLTDCENRTGSEVTSSGKLRFWVWFDTGWKKNRQGGSRVSHVPLRKIEMIKQVRQGDQPWYPIQDRSFVAHGRSRMPCAPAWNEMKWNSLLEMNK